MDNSLNNKGIPGPELIRRFEQVFEKIEALEIAIELKEMLRVNVTELAVLGMITPDQVLADLMMKSSKIAQLNSEYAAKITGKPVKSLVESSPQTERRPAPSRRSSSLSIDIREITRNVLGHLRGIKPSQDE